MCHTQTTFRNQTDRAISLNGHWDWNVCPRMACQDSHLRRHHAALRLSGLRTSAHAAPELQFASCSHPSPAILSLWLEICAASHVFRSSCGSSSSTRREACILRAHSCGICIFGSACLTSVMLASNDKERAVSLTLRTLLRTFVRIPVHLYLNSLHCVMVTLHSVTQL